MEACPAGQAGNPGGYGQAGGQGWEPWGTARKWGAGLGDPGGLNVEKSRHRAGS